MHEVTLRITEATQQPLSPLSSTHLNIGASCRQWLYLCVDPSRLASKRRFLVSLSILLLSIPLSLHSHIYKFAL